MDHEILAADLEASRAALLGDRVDLETLAKAFNFTTRTIYAMTERFHLAFVKIAGRRYFSATDVRAAASRDTIPRKPGRPRRAA